MQMLRISLNCFKIFTNLLFLICLSPSLFTSTGDLGEEDEVFQWILTQKNDESIEDVDRETFLKYIEIKDFLAVVFCENSSDVYLEFWNNF